MTRPLLIVVDDEPEMAEFVGDVAETLGFDVRIATSAKGFQEIWPASEPSAVVMDVVMPDMDGNELLQWLTEHDCTVPIVLMSGYDGKYLELAEKLGTARGAPVVGTLRKPIRLRDLEALLNDLLQACS